jgi:NAD(P)-dependent dehydrogenase (short-subunit alcohol dehydrogenase family)
VTGGASGIGWAIALALREQGARVHLCDASPELLAEALRQQPEMSGTVADVSDEQHVDRMFDDVLFLCSPAGRNISGQSLGVCGNVESLR